MSGERSFRPRPILRVKTKGKGKRGSRKFLKIEAKSYTTEKEILHRRKGVFGKKSRTGKKSSIRKRSRKPRGKVRPQGGI